MFSKLFKKKPKKVIVVYLYVKRFLTVDEVNVYMQETARNFKDIVGERASVIVLPSYTETKVEIIPL